LSGSTKKPGRNPRPSQIQAEALLGALPHPLLVIGEGMKIDYVNTAAEDFFQMSAAVFCRRLVTDVVAFGSPLIALVEQVQRNGTTVNEYGVDLGSFRFEAPSSSISTVDQYLTCQAASSSCCNSAAWRK